MKEKIFVILIVLFTGCKTRNSTGSIEIKEQMFNSVLNYMSTEIDIKSYLDFNQNVHGFNIFDSIVFLEYTTFVDRISSNNGKFSVLDSLYLIDQSRYFENYKFDNLNLLNHNPNSKLVVFFSEPYRGSLMVEIATNINNGISKEDILEFNSSINFLFSFDKDYKINSYIESMALYD